MNSLITFIKCLNPILNISQDRIIVKTDSDNITYQTLNQKVTSAAKHLSESGIQSGKIVPILCNHSIDYIIAVLALWILDAIPAPLNGRLSSAELVDQINFLNAKFLVQLTSNINLNLQSIAKLDFSISKYSEDFEFKGNIKLNQTAIILFTSGSSGKPKAVELTFSNLINSAIIGNKFLNQTNKDCWLASLPFYHIGGFSILFRALMFGAQVILPYDLKLYSIIQSINKFKPSLISLVSAQIDEILKSNIHPNKELRHILLGGGFIDLNLMQEALKKGWRVCKVYGSTETASFITVLTPEDFKNKPHSAGKPIPPNEIFIFDENDKQLPPFGEGEIVVKSSAVLKGYFNDDELTNQKLKDGFYFTGDIGYKDEEGYLYVVNRRNNLIVTGGENVNPLEVEAAILKFPKVKEVCVLGVENDKWGQKIVAAIVVKPNQKFKLEELKDFLRDKTASFKIPKKIYFVDELPKTELQKVNRKKVKKLLFIK